MKIKCILLFVFFAASSTEAKHIILGNQTIDKSRILHLIEGANSILEIKQMLYKSNLFENVEISLNDDEQFLITVKENKLLKNVNFVVNDIEQSDKSWNLLSWHSLLLKISGLTLNKIITNKAILSAKKQIEQYYKIIGYQDVEIKVEIEGQNKCNVNFSIVYKNKLKYSAPVFIGLGFSESLVFNIMMSAPSESIFDSLFVKNVSCYFAMQDKMRIEEFLQLKGFKDAKVACFFKPMGNTIIPIVKIDQCQKHTITLLNIKFDESAQFLNNLTNDCVLYKKDAKIIVHKNDLCNFDNDLTLADEMPLEKSLNDALNGKVGKNYNADEFTSEDCKLFVKAIEQFYKSYNFNVTLQCEQIVNEKKEITYEYTISYDSNKQIISKIIIIGNVALKASVIANAARVFEGDYFDSNTKNDIISNVHVLSQIENVSVQSYSDDSNNVIIEIHVKEIAKITTLGLNCSLKNFDLKPLLHLSAPKLSGAFSGNASTAALFGDNNNLSAFVSVSTGDLLNSTSKKANWDDNADRGNYTLQVAYGSTSSNYLWHYSLGCTLQRVNYLTYSKANYSVDYTFLMDNWKAVCSVVNQKYSTDQVQEIFVKNNVYEQFLVLALEYNFSHYLYWFKNEVNYASVYLSPLVFKVSPKSDYAFINRYLKLGIESAMRQNIVFFEDYYLTFSLTGSFGVLPINKNWVNGYVEEECYRSDIISGFSPYFEKDAKIKRLSCNNKVMFSFEIFTYHTAFAYIKPMCGVYLFKLWGLPENLPLMNIKQKDQKWHSYAFIGIQFELSIISVHVGISKVIVDNRTVSADNKNWQFEFGLSAVEIF